MRVERRSGADERKIITAMIVNRTVLGEIASRWEKEMFRSRWSNIIGQWCVDFFNKYNKAPNNAIESIFGSWCDGNKDKDTINLIEKYLSSISDEYESLADELNADYVLDLAGRYFNRVRLKRLADQVLADVESNDLDRASKAVTAYHRTEVGVGSAIDVFQDVEAVRKAFDDTQESIIKYPGALGTFFGDALARDSFVSFMAPEKRGKTFWLIDMAWRAVLQRKRVAFFEIGDLSQNQIMRRLMIRASGRPKKPVEIDYPLKITRDEEENTATVVTEKRHLKKVVTWQEAWKSLQNITQTQIKSKDTYLKLSVHPNSTITVAGIQSILQSWERRKWVPDVIVIDYADLLAPPPGNMESRDSINQTWKQLRSLSQQLHCLVLTATQANAASYKAGTVDMGNFSEDKRKFAHVTGMLGINSTPEEKLQGIARLNWVVLREDEFITSRCVHVAQCLHLSLPAVRSCF